ncbi:hypothetical protein SD457_21535 [Coprobacillaceae bacterium CR2/5/TPMF4]|nr:hypothetical protein SD457_21535 [Coprobacillaceae bacterium CR2/5/TPMF4]
MHLTNRRKREYEFSSSYTIRTTWGIGIWDSRVGGIWMLDRPLVLGPIVGLILGILKQESLLVVH